jgi:CRISPR-associated protein Cmr5
MSNKTSVHQTLEQRRATLAAECSADKGFSSREYRSLAKKVPAMLMTNGLGQTLAYLQAKAKGSETTAEGLIYKHLSKWLKHPNCPVKWIDQSGRPVSDDDLLKRIQNVPSVVYRQATREALIFAGWLKRFAEALAPKEGEGREEAGETEESSHE